MTWIFAFSAGQISEANDRRRQADGGQLSTGTETGRTYRLRPIFSFIIWNFVYTGRFDATFRPREPVINHVLAFINAWIFSARAELVAIISLTKTIHAPCVSHDTLNY